MTQLDHALLTKLNPVVIDFETYYDKTYSLSNKEMTTQQYILDDRFELIGVGIKELGKPPSWYTGAAIKPALDTLKLHTRVVVAHNAVFDGTILSLQLGIIPRLLIDTMSLMRPIGANLLTPSSLAACATFLRTQGVDIADKGDAVVQALGKSLGHFTPQELAEYGDYCMHDCEIISHLG